MGGRSVLKLGILNLTRLSVAIAVVGITFGIVQAHAGAQPLVRISLDGKSAEFKDTSFPASLQSVRFYAQSNADFTQPLAISVKAPEGAVVSVQAARTRARNPSSVKRAAFYPVPMKKSGASAVSESIRLRPTSSKRSLTSSTSRPENATVLSEGCCGLSNENLDVLLQFGFGSCSNYQCVCDALATESFCSANPGSGGGTPTPGGGGSSDLPGFTDSSGEADDQYYASALIEGAFSKDACARSDIPSLLVITVDLSKVTRSRLTNGVSVNIAALERTYNGSRAASIKPVSDGMFAPRPLLLMARAAYGREVARIVRWKHGKPRVERVYDELYSAFYRELSLIRVPIELPGGWASVDLLDDDSFTRGYGVCLELARRRQRINGYPTSPKDG